MPRTRRQTTLGIAATTSSPIELVRLSLKSCEDLQEVLKQQQNHPQPLASFGALFGVCEVGADETVRADAVRKEVERILTARKRETNVQRIMRQLIPVLPDMKELRLQIENFEQQNVVPKITTKLHRFLRLWEDNKAIFQEVTPAPVVLPT
jgi:hypothetical protein